MEKLKAYVCGGWCCDKEAYPKADVDKYIAEMEENHRKEVAQLLMEISGLKKSVEVANKVIKQKGGFTIKDIKFGGVKLEGIDPHKKEA